MDKQNFMVINLSQIKLPTFTENKYLDWVKYGEDDSFPYFLQYLSNRSALHNAIVSSKIDYGCGEGLTYKKKKDSKTDKFLESANPKESLNDVFRKLLYDYVLYGGYAIRVIMGGSKKVISEIYHMEFDKVRCGKKDELGNIKEFYWSRDFKNYRKADNVPYIYPAYEYGSKEPEQVIYYNEYRPGCEYYPLPSYVGALNYIETDVEISNFHLANVKNGFLPSYHLSFNNGEPTSDERKAIERQIKEKYVGTDNAAKFLLTFSSDKEHAPVINTLTPSQLDKQFITLLSSVLQNVLTGHKITSPMLVGIQTPGQLGGASELDIAFNIYLNNIIKPLQNAVLKTINNICAINGYQELYIEQNKPINFNWTEQILASIMTLDEKREAVGLEPMKIDEQTPQTEVPVAPEQNNIQ